MQRTCLKCKHVNSATTAETADTCPKCGVLYARAAQDAVSRSFDWRHKALLGVLTVLIPWWVYQEMWGTNATRRQSEASLSATLATQRAIVFNSGLDGSVFQVERWLKANLKDPASLGVIEWGSVVAGANNEFQVRVKYRAKNSFGGYAVEQKIFRLDSAGTVVGVSDT